MVFQSIMFFLHCSSQWQWVLLNFCENIKVWTLWIKSFDFITQFFFNGFFIFLLHSQYFDMHFLSYHIQFQVSSHENTFQANVPKHKIVLPCFLFQMLPWLGKDCFICLFAKLLFHIFVSNIFSTVISSGFLQLLVVLMNHSVDR